MKKMKNYLKLGILLIGFSLLLLNCQKEEIYNVTLQNTNSIKIKTVSLEDAKNQFQIFKKNKPKAKGINTLVVTPDWNTLNQEPLFYTNEMLTKVDVSINRTGNFTTEVLFIEVNGEMKNVIYTLYIDSLTSNGDLKNARVYLTELNGDYIDGYGFENGLITTRFLPKKNSNSLSSKNIAAKYDYPTSFWGENSSSTETGGDGDTNGGGSSCTDCVLLEVVVVKGYLKDPYAELNDFFNPINEFTNIDDDLGSNDDTTSGISISTIKEVTTAVVIDPIVKCDPGFMLINGNCVVDTETPCAKPGYVRNDNGICRPAPDQIINELEDKAECVYGKMVDQNNNINWILENFKDGDNPYNPSQFNLKFQMSTTLNSLTNASTATPKQSGIPNTFVISINTNTLSGRTSLGIARTIIHEGVHARLWEFMYSRDKNLAIISNDFPGIYNYYKNHQQNWDHEQMAAFYRGTIAKGLKQFDNGQHSDIFYNALAWEGLSEIKDANNNHELIYTEAWKKLTLAEQTAILQIITDEKASGSKECL
ncbi:MAG: hypothetical protein JKZ03_04525 [Flavobacteriaceae bacterium]|nr:hypothetical protein [Flavobacteriaceae bacterium]